MNILVRQAGFCSFILMFVGLTASAGALPGRMEYAVNLGKTDGPVCRFLPVGSTFWQEGKCWGQLTSATVSAAEGYEDEADLYKTYVYPDNATAGLTASYVLPGLVPGKSYTLRLHVCEVYYTSEGNRTFDVLVNGVTTIEALDAFKTAGAKLKGAFVDVPVTADANGRLTVAFKNVANQFNVAAIEVFSSDEGLPVVAPRVRRENAGANVLTIETRHAAYRYDVEYRDGNGGSARVLAENVLGLRLVDACGTATRQYRVRTVSGVSKGTWSEWTGVDATLRASDVVWRVACADSAQSAPDGWIKDEPFRLYPADATLEFKTWWKVFDLSWFSEAERPPLLLFQLAIDSTDKPLAYRFTGLDPVRKYRVRIHQMEAWDKVAGGGWRVFAYHFNGALAKATAVTGETQVDPYVLAGNAALKAAAVDYVVTPDCAGTLLVAGENIQSVPYWFGFEIHPLDEGYAAPGRIAAAFYADAQADGQQSAAVTERFVENRAFPTLRISKDDLPTGCSGSLTHLYAHGRIHVPAAGAYRFSVRGQGHLSLFADGKVLVERRDLDGTSFVTDAVDLTAGEHILYADLRQTAVADFGLVVELSDEPSGFVPALSNVLSPAPARADFGKWRRYVRGPLAQNNMPSYVVPLSDDGSSFRIYGSGDNMYDTVDTGTMLVRAGIPTDHTYVSSMRITAVGGGYSENTLNTRAGLLAVAPLPAKDRGGMFLCSGFTSKGTQRRFTGYYDWTGPENGGFKIRTTHQDYVSQELPVWIRSTKTAAPEGKWCYKQEYSSDGKDWSLQSRQLDYSRSLMTQDEAVGPIVVFGVANDSRLAWMDIDNLFFKDTTPKGFALFLR